MSSNKCYFETWVRSLRLNFHLNWFHYCYELRKFLTHENRGKKFGFHRDFSSFFWTWKNHHHHPKKRLRNKFPSISIFLTLLFLSLSLSLPLSFSLTSHSPSRFQFSIRPSNKVKIISISTRILTAIPSHLTRTINFTSFLGFNLIILYSLSSLSLSLSSHYKSQLKKHHSKTWELRSKYHYSSHCAGRSNKK